MKRILFALVSLFMFTILSAQETMQVENKKVGKLASEVGKSNAQKVRQLTITGILGNKDFEFISTMSNLEELNFIEATLSDEDYKEGKLSFIRRGLLTFPPMPSLKKLYAGDSRHLELLLGNSVPNLKELYVSNTTKEISISSGTQQESTQPLNPKAARMRVRNIGSGNENTENVYLDVFGVKLVNSNNDINEYSYREDKYRYYSRRGTYENEYNFNAYEGLPIKAKVLEIPTKYYLYCSDSREPRKPYKDVFPNIIKCEKENITILNLWDSSFDQSLLDEVDSLAIGAFYNSTMSSFKVPKKVKVLTKFCFKGCANLKEIDLTGIETIEGCAFAGTAIEKINLPSTIKELSTTAFLGSNIKQAEFLGNYPPELYRDINWNSENDINNNHLRDELQANQVRFIVPEGRLNAFQIGKWKKVSLKQKGTKTEYAFTVKMPGTLATQLTEELAPNIEELVIKGVLYDTDFEAIRKCTNLRSIDISHCYIVKSPETIKNEEEKSKYELAMIAAVARMANIDAQSKFENGLGSKGTVEYTNSFAEVFEALVDNFDALKVKADESCYFPRNAFDEMKFLEKIVFPLQLKNLDIWVNSPVLSEIVLPPYLETLKGRTATQTNNIRKVNFPSSLKIIGANFFNSCTSLEEIDLSNTQVEQIEKGAFENCKSLKLFKGSKCLKKLEDYSGNSFGFGTKNTVVGYFYTLEEPRGIHYGDFKEIHIPRGSKAGWSYDKVIDDIEE